MWNDHPFSQRRRTTERIVRVGVGGDREVMGWRTLEKRAGVGNIGGGGLHKIGG